MSKRIRFVLISIILSFGFLSIQYLPGIFEQYRFYSIGALSFLSLVLFAWAIREGLGLNMTLLSLVLPFMFTLGVGLFWFLLPSSLITKIPVLIIFVFGIYALSPTANIFTVATTKTIPLMRAAKGVGFVMTLFTMFLLYDTIFSLKSNIYISTLLVGAVSFPLNLQSFWSVKLVKEPTLDVFLASLVCTVILIETSALLFFWPVTVIVGSLFLTVVAYTMLGLGQSHLEGRLFSQTVREYLYVGVAVFIGMYLATSWSG